MAKMPAARGFTVAEKRSLTFEKIALYVMFLVAIIAAVISFVALAWVGREIGLGTVSLLVPFAIDGFAVACSVGVIRSQAEGERARARLSEWAGLGYALGLSLMGNIVHALNTTYGTPVPVWLVWAYASAPPVIVAYGLHVYGRAQHKGLSAHVMADDPAQIHFGLAHLGDDRAQPRAPKAAPRAQTPPAPRATPAQDTRAARTTSAQPTPADARPARADETREEVFEQYRVRLAEGDRMDGKELGELLGLHPGRARSLRIEWDQRIAELDVAAPTRDPIADQLPTPVSTPERQTA